jgi:hypothetical protein
MSVIIRNLAIAGYRSFGAAPQLFENFSKVNLLIGRNNAGKSNVIRFLSEVYPKTDGRQPLKIEPLMHHLPSRPKLLIGKGEVIHSADDGSLELREDFPLLNAFVAPAARARANAAFAKIFDEKRKIDGTGICWTFQSLPDRKDNSPAWLKAIKAIDDQTLKMIWGTLKNMQGGDRLHSWEPQVVAHLPGEIIGAQVSVIPAIRQIGAKGSIFLSFDGSGIIDRLARLQNPDAHNQSERDRFVEVTNFLRSVLDDPEVSLEIPYERDTILIHIDGKVLPIESLGSGIHEVIILAAAATVLTESVVCIEEPELHLNPILQRKLIRYISEYTSNQYFISTHSPALMDTPGVEIYHLKLNSGETIVERVTSDNQRSSVCEDLGYHPSDLLQANSILWVEGPSDRIYINYWLKHVDPNLVEGVHYSIMFYGGRLASHLSNEDYTAEVNEFISLRRLNRRGVIVLDSDRDKKGAKLNATKLRLQKEFDAGPGHTWVTDGREIENYMSQAQLQAAICHAMPSAASYSAMGRYDNCLKVHGRNGRETQAPKVEVARYVANTFPPDLTILNLKIEIFRLVSFIRDSNPLAHAKNAV